MLLPHNRLALLSVVAAVLVVMLVAVLVPSLVQANSVNSADQPVDSSDVDGTLPQASPSLTRVSPGSYSVSLDRNERKTFTVTASDSDDDLRRYEWYVDGERENSHNYSTWVSVFGIGGWVGSSPDGPVTESFSHTFSEERTYLVQVVFYDKDDDQTWLTWSVNTSNVAPTVTRNSPGSPISLFIGGEETFEVTANDRGNRLKKYEWFVNGNSEHDYTWIVLPSGDKTETFEHSFDTPGRNTVTASFTDDYGASRSTSWTVNVTNRPHTLTRNSPDPSLDLNIGEEETFSVTANDPDNRLKSYEWFVNNTSEDEGVWRFALPTGDETRTFEHTFDTPGRNTVRVIFTDDYGLERSTSWTVNVTNRPHTLTRNSPDSSLDLNIGEEETFSVTANDPDNKLKSYEWFVNNTSEDEGVWRFALPTGDETSTFEHTFDTPGRNTVRVTFTDDYGLERSTSWTVNIGNSPPSVFRTSPTEESPEVEVSEPQTFTATATDDEGNLASWRWEIERQTLPPDTTLYPTFGIDEQSLGSVGNVSRTFPSQPHTFDSVGTYRVTAIFTDSAGASGSATWMVEVTDTADQLPHEFEAAVTRVFPVRGMHVGQSATVNVDWSVNITNPLQVTGPTFALSASFFRQGSPLPIPDTTERIIVPVAASKSTLLTVPNPSEPGDYQLCASIGSPAVLAGSSSSDFDADSSNDSACKEVRILPDLGVDFPEGLVAFPFTDDRHEPYWVYVPDAYTEPVKVANSIGERTWGGFEHWNDRKNQYKHLALDVARRGQNISGRIILIDVPDNKKIEILTELSSNAESLAVEFEPLELASEPAIENAELLVSYMLATNHITPEYADSVFNHLGHASQAVNTASYIAKYGPILLDIVASESVNRAIVVVDAEKILAALEALPMGDAWEEAVKEARADIAEMTHPDAMVRWAKAIEDHLDELAIVTARLAATYAAKAAATKALITAGFSGGPLTVIVAVVAAVISAGYFAIDETGKFWDGMSLAATTAQVYTHLYTSDPDSYKGDLDLQAKIDGKNLALGYLKFAFYQYLHEAADSSDLVPILGIKESLARDKAREISDQRDLALAGELEMGWQPEEDFKSLNTKRPLDIWSDGQTMWAIDGQSVNDHLIHGYHMVNKNELSDKELKFGTTFLQLGVIPDVVLNSANRSIWRDPDTRTMWVMDNAGTAELFAYDTVQKSRDEEREFDIGDIYPFDFSALKPIADAIYGVASLFTADPSKPAPETLAESLVGQFLKSQGVDLRELLTLPDLTPGGIWSDGETMWFATMDSIHAYDLSDKSPLPNKDFSLDADNTNALGLWSHSGTMWVSDGEDGMIYAYRMSDMSRDPANDLYTVKVPKIANNSTPTGIWSDGETMWVADRESDRIFAYTLPDSLSPPLNLTATVSGTGGDSQVDLTWQAPSDTGRTAITGYVMEESEDGLAWKQLVGNTASTSTSYSDQRSVGWSVRHYRVAAINSSGVGLFSATVTAFRTFGIDSIGCLPALFYAGDPVECSPTIVGDSTEEFTYAWRAHDGAVTWDVADSSTASVTWDSPGAKQLRVVACRSGDASEYVNKTVPIVGLTGTADVASGGACAEATQTVHVADPTPRLAPGKRLPDDTIALGESIGLTFSLTRTTWVGGPGGITVSFPDLTLAKSDDGSAPYESGQGQVTTISYYGNNSQIDYLDSGGTETVEDTNGNNIQPSYLIVATDNDRWPPSHVPPERTLKLRVTPKQAGEFRIYYRYWLCNEERLDEQGNPYCHRYPEPEDSGNGTLDQQGWAVRVFTVTVIAPPAVETLGCTPGAVNVGVTVTCTPTISGGAVETYAWRAGDDLAGGDPWSGSDATFSTSWDFSGQQTVRLEVCNVILECVSAEQTITVNPDPDAPEPMPVVPPTIEEEQPDDGGRVLIAGPASGWAHSDYTPTDATIQVRAVPTSPIPTLEISIYDEDGFASAAGSLVSPGALVLALPEDVWVEYGQISTEIHIAGSWVDYTGELEQSLLALESASGDARRTAATALGLSPAAGEEALTAADRLAWGLGATGGIPVDDIFQARYANCVSQVAVAWLAWAAETKGVRISVPVDLSPEDYVSLAAAFIAAEPDATGGKEPTLVQAHDLLDTGEDARGCQ